MKDFFVTVFWIFMILVFPLSFIAAAAIIAALALAVVAAQSLLERYEKDVEVLPKDSE